MHRSHIGDGNGRRSCGPVFCLALVLVAVACGGPPEKPKRSVQRQLPPIVPDSATPARAPRFTPSKDYVTDGYGDTVVWSSTRPLTWSDFRRPEKDPTIVTWAAANTTMRLYCKPFKKPGGGLGWDVRAVMKRDLSWVDPRWMHDSTLLYHERLHFDIAELYARKLRRHMARWNGPQTKEGADAVKVFIQQYNDSVFIMGERYDKETEHHGNRAEQLRWEADIAARLKELERYR